MAFSYRLFDTKADTKIDSKSYKASFLSRPFLTPLHVLYKTHPYFQRTPHVIRAHMWRQGPHAQSAFQRISITRRFFGRTRQAFGQRLVSFRYLPA